MSSNDIAKSLQTEKSIYDTPYSHKEDYGPIYSTPADNEKKIYEEYAGKRFRKLLHKEIKLVYLLSVCAHYNFMQLLAFLTFTYAPT